MYGTVNINSLFVRMVLYDDLKPATMGRVYSLTLVVEWNKLLNCILYVLVLEHLFI